MEKAKYLLSDVNLWQALKLGGVFWNVCEHQRHCWQRLTCSISQTLYATAGCCLRWRSSVLNLTSDVVAVQQRLHVADLLQQSSLGKKEVLLCAEKNTTQKLVFYKSWIQTLFTPAASWFLPARMNSNFMASGNAMWSVNWGSKYFNKSSTAPRKTHTNKII